MIRFGCTIFLSIWAICLSAQDWIREDLKIYRDFQQLEKDILNTDSDSTYIVNFWATWCAPCVKELPYFEALEQKLQKDHAKARVILVSLDFEKQIDTRLLGFLNKHKVASQVVVLLDPKESEWIDKVDPKWSGAIPVTLVIDDNGKTFYEKVFHSQEELEQIIK